MAVLAPALVRCRSEINAAAPNRDRSSDGWIGDKPHALTGLPENGGSDHNPNRRNIVDAIDVDVDGISPAAVIAKMIKHPSCNYVIYNRTIWSRRYGFAARKYTGSNPHTKHLHCSILQKVAAENSTVPWGIADIASTPVTSPGAGSDPQWAQRLHAALPVLEQSTAIKGSVRKLQALVNAHIPSLNLANGAAAGGSLLDVDGVFGAKTAAVVEGFQRLSGLTVDGIVGPKTWAKLTGTMPTIERGAFGTDVTKVQHLLNVASAGLKTDGKFGEATQASVRIFQGQFGLAKDGVVGPQTWTALLTR